MPVCQCQTVAAQRLVPQTALPCPESSTDFAVMDMSRLAGRVAVVTGAGGGLGSAIAEDLVQAGLKVVGVDLHIDNVQAMAERLTGVASGSLHPLCADIRKEVDIKRTFQWIEENLGAVAVIVNNAGIARMTPIADCENAEMSAILDTNVLGLAAATREAIRSMKKHNVRDGHVININSTVGRPESVSREWMDLFHAGMYAASKHAVSGFNQALRAEIWGQELKIRVTDLCPGTVKTPLVEDKFLKAIDNRVLQPSDIARAVRFVLSSPPSVEIVHLTVQPTGEIW